MKLEYTNTKGTGKINMTKTLQNSYTEKSSTRKNGFLSYITRQAVQVDSALPSRTWGLLLDSAAVILSHDSR